MYVWQSVKFVAFECHTKKEIQDDTGMISLKDHLRVSSHLTLRNQSHENAVINLNVCTLLIVVILWLFVLWIGTHESLKWKKNRFFWLWETVYHRLNDSCTRRLHFHFLSACLASLFNRFILFYIEKSRNALSLSRVLFILEISFRSKALDMLYSTYTQLDEIICQRSNAYTFIDLFLIWCLIIIFKIITIVKIEAKLVCIGFEIVTHNRPISILSNRVRFTTWMVMGKTSENSCHFLYIIIQSVVDRKMLNSIKRRKLYLKWLISYMWLL